MGAPVSRRIAVVGAGAAGLATAKYLLEHGHEVCIYEIGTRVGGLWAYDNDSGRSSAYKSLHINTWKGAAHYRDFPFPFEVGEYPNHREMDAYFNAYADAFDLRRRIRFRSRVTRIAPVPEAEGGEHALRWRVATERGDSDVHDAVAVAAGHLTEPSMPAFAERFEGELLHAHHYKEPTPYKDKRVLVIGTGNSGCDITADVCVLTERTVMAARSPELITPKFVLGVPLVWLEMMAKRRWLPRNTNLWVRKLATRLVHGRMEKWGFRTPKGRTHPISHATLINHIAYRRVHVKPGVRDVEGRVVTFDDGSREEFDVMICATGYLMDFPFLPEGLVPSREEAHDKLDLFGRAVPHAWPGLYFVGYFNVQGLSNIRMFEHQGDWIGRVESGEVLLPEIARMREWARQEREYISRRYPPGPRYAFEMEAGRFTKWLGKELAHGRRRRRRAEEDGADPAALLANRSTERRVDAAALEAVLRQFREDRSA